MKNKMVLALSLLYGLGPGLSANCVHEAVTLMDGARFQRLIDGLPLELLNEPDEAGNTPLMVAVAAGKVIAVKQLLARGVDARAHNGQKTALLMATNQLASIHVTRVDPRSLGLDETYAEIDSSIREHLEKEGTGEDVVLIGTIEVDEDRVHFSSEGEEPKPAPAGNPIKINNT